MFKKTLIAAALSTMMLTTVSAEVALDTELKKNSYATGMMLGQQLKGGLERTGEQDYDALVEAISDILGGKETQLTNEEMTTILQKKQEEQMALAKKAGEEAKTTGEAFLAEYAKKDGVKKSDDGIFYKVITEGTGKMPAESDTVKVHYRGTLKDGTEFDSSYKRGEPAQFPVGGVIVGWQKTLQMMKAGAKWEVAIPSELAYGERGAGANIGPNEPLVFEIELLEIL